MKKILVFAITLVLLACSTAFAVNHYPCSALIGGGTGALDAIVNPGLGDVAYVTLNGHASYGNASFQYVYHNFGGAVSDNPPYEIKDDSAQNANYAWVLTWSSIAVPVVATSAHTVTLGEVRAGIAQQKTNAVTWSLPAAAAAGYGTPWCVYNFTDTKVITVDANGSEVIVLKGVAGSGGVAVTSDGADGDYACFVAVTDVGDGSTDGWVQYGYGLTDWQ